MADDVIRDAPAGFPRAAGFRAGDYSLNNVAWGAIWAGVMVTIGMEVLLLAFGVFIAAAIGGSSIWTMAWYLVTMAISFYIGAWSAARLADVSVREICILHGITTWGLATLATALIGGTLGWAAFVRTGIEFSATLWGPTEQWAGIVWGGLALSLATAYLGGANGLRRDVATAQRETIPEPRRRAG